MIVIDNIHRRSLRAVRKQAIVRNKRGELVWSPRREMFLNKQCGQYTKDLWELRCQSQSPVAFNAALQRHFGKFSTRVTVMAHVATHRIGRTLAPARLDELANLIDFRTPARPVRVFFIPREEGKSPRRITSWSELDYARQILVADVLRVCDPHAV